MSANTQNDKHSKPASTIVVGALVIAKVAKFSRESPGLKVMGSLLGMQSESTLEVTDCFLFPDMRQANVSEDGDDDAGGAGEIDNDAIHNYKSDMIEAMRTVNSDFDEVGLFQICPAKALFDENLISHLLTFQSRMPSSIILAYDPTVTEEDTLSIRAYRLNASALALFRAKENEFKQKLRRQNLERGSVISALTSDELTYKMQNKYIRRLTSSNIFDEVPVKLHASVLARAAIPDLVADATKEARFEDLDRSMESFLQENINVMSECIEQLQDDAQKYYRFKDSAAKTSDIAQFYSDFKEENERPPTMREIQEKFPDELELPSGVKPLLVNSQISAYCDHLAQFASQGISTAYMQESVGAVHDDE